MDRCAGLGTVATGAAVSVLAATAAVVVQPKAGRALDAGRLTTRTGLLGGPLITAAPEHRRTTSLWVTSPAVPG
ncbi:hypothetical protein [Streptomyces exfoliatus]|uniref:hypothetical protein n=1 Tax=Streptomyces exfoliatus TaxID=1905 RepID=UPI000464EF45|nr:hypothetical protein [Streptomyces exfoliatus]